MLTDLLELARQHGASDLHLKTGSPPILRVDGRLEVLADKPVLDTEAMRTLFQELTADAQRQKFEDDLELDFSFQQGELDRYRVNAALQMGELSISMRRFTLDVPALDALGLPPLCGELALRQQGLILVTGPTGSGKSTTLAAMIQHINQTAARRIVTVEDPVEYIYKDRKSIITQREIGRDTRSFALATRQALRQDPDVILVGEMRDPETMAACLTAAETGHLVLSTLHTNNGPQSIDRIVDSFPPHQQSQIRMQLSLTLAAVISQRLLPRADGPGRIPAVELMLANSAIRNLTREGKTHQIANAIQTGREAGMQNMEQALADLVRGGQVRLEDARPLAGDAETFRSLLDS
ncbi:MAG: type IV pilus twitching motility protein PilT [Anaerolineales bacterium]